MAKEAVESYARPLASLREEQIQVFRERAKRVLEELIGKKGKNPKDYVFRDLLPKTDLGLTNEEWKHTYSAAYTEEDMVSKTLDDDRFIVIFGYTNTSPDPKTLYFKLLNGVNVEKVIHVQHLYVYEVPEGYFDPVGWAEGEKITIKVYGNATGDDYPVFIGLIAEPKGETVSA